MNAGFELPSRFEVERAEPQFDLRKYINFVWRQWVFIGAVTALSLLLAALYLVRATPIYTATAQVLLDPRREKAVGADAILSDFQLDDSAAIESQLAIIKSDSLLRRVVLKERLAGPGSPPNMSQSGPEGEFKSREAQQILDAINRLRGALAVARGGQSYVLDVSISWQNPLRAAQLANAVADAYVLDQLDARLEAAKRASGWLSDRLVELRQQLRDSEEAVAKFRTDNGLARTGPNVTLNDQQLAELNNKLVAARADAAEKKTRIDFLADFSLGHKTVESLPDSLQSTIQSGVMGTLRQKLAEVSQREADMLARYSSRHPSVVNVQAEKRDIERSIAAETQRMIVTVKSEYSLAKAREEAAERAVREATGQGGLDSGAAIRLRELERTVAVNKTLFEDFLHRAKITEEQSTFRAHDARVITAAQPPGAPSSPRVKNVLMMAVVLGLGLGVSGALALEMLNSGFTTPREIESLLGIPVLASIICIKNNKVKQDGTAIPLPCYPIHHPLSVMTESIRTLRSGIHMSDVDRPPRVIQVSSADAGEGKTTIALSVAISASRSGLKTVFVDADLRHPSATRFFKLERKKGLVDLLTGAAAAEEVMTVWKEAGLMVVPAGARSLNPPDVLGSERMKSLVRQLRENFDYVVVDTPPVGPFADSAIIARLVDKTVFVIRWRSTPRELVSSCIQSLSVQRRVGGIVLNFVNQSRAKKYGGDHYFGRRYYDK